MSTIITKKRSTLSNLSKSAYNDMYKSSILTVAPYSLPVLSKRVSRFLTRTHRFSLIFTVQLLRSFVTVRLFESVTDCDGDVSHLIKETVINHPEPHHLITNINR